MLTSLRPAIRAMAGYTPGEQPRDDGIVKLNTNENPYPPSPRVIAAIEEVLHNDKLRKYPDPLGTHFRQTAGRVLGVDPDGVLIGNGSDDVLTIITRAFVPEGGLVVSPTPTYLLYNTLADIQGARFESVPFVDGWRLPKPWPIPDAHLTFVPNPNSPSGTMVALDALEQLSNELQGPLVIDEAYADFAEWNALAWKAMRLTLLPNVIVTRSFSKSYSLAGLRLGFAVTAPTVVRELNKVKDSYNCDALSLAGGAAALDDQAYFQIIRAKVIATRERMQQTLPGLGFEVTPSHANFVWCTRKDRPVKAIFEELKKRNLLVRYMDYRPHGDGLRISVGTDAEIDRLFDELRRIA
jgi:histidinol-phosphate aminotransferase